jgi:hypothetical protein
MKLMSCYYTFSNVPIKNVLYLLCIIEAIHDFCCAETNVSYCALSRNSQTPRKEARHMVSKLPNLPFPPLPRLAR